MPIFMISLIKAKFIDQKLKGKKLIDQDKILKIETNLLNIKINQKSLIYRKLIKKKYSNKIFKIV